MTSRAGRSGRWPRQPAQARKPETQSIAADLTVGANLRPPAALQFDQHGRPVSLQNVIGIAPFHPWKRKKRNFWVDIAKRVFPPNGVPAAYIKSSEVINLMFYEARRNRITADRNKDRNTILRAAGRKK